MPLWPVMALMAIMAYGLWQDQCDYYGYPVKEHKKTNMVHYDALSCDVYAVLRTPQLDILVCGQKGPKSQII